MIPSPPLLSFNQFSPDEWCRKMSLAGCTGGEVEPLVKGCLLTAGVGGDVVGSVLIGASGAVVVHKAVQHIVIRIRVIIILFMAITKVIMAMRNTCVDKLLFYKIFRNLPSYFSFDLTMIITINEDLIIIQRKMIFPGFTIIHAQRIKRTLQQLGINLQS